MATARKNQSRAEFHALVPYTAVELLSMSGSKMRELIYGKLGGRLARPGVKEEIQRIIAEWRAADSE